MQRFAPPGCGTTRRHAGAERAAPLGRPWAGVGSCVWIPAWGCVASQQQCSAGPWPLRAGAGGWGTSALPHGSKGQYLRSAGEQSP